MFNKFRINLYTILKSKSYQTNLNPFNKTQYFSFTTKNNDDPNYKHNYNSNTNQANQINSANQKKNQDKKYKHNTGNMDERSRKFIEEDTKEFTGKQRKLTEELMEKGIYYITTYNNL